MPEVQDNSSETPQPEPDSNWQFHPNTAQLPATPPPPTQNLQPVHWTASEFIEHNKSVNWYLLLVLGGGALAAVVYLLTKDKISTAMIVTVTIVFGIFAARHPRELEYTVDETGVRIGNKFYPYANFKSFSVVQEGAIEAIWLMPLKRFLPIISIYFAPGDGQKITGVLTNYLPVENRQPDPVDRLMHRLRF